MLAKKKHPSKFLFQKKTNSVDNPSWEKEGNENLFLAPQNTALKRKFCKFFKVFFSFRKNFLHRPLTLFTTFLVSPCKPFKHSTSHHFEDDTSPYLAPSKHTLSFLFQSAVPQPTSASRSRLLLCSFLLNLIQVAPIILALIVPIRFLFFLQPTTLKSLHLAQTSKPHLCTNPFCNASILVGQKLLQGGLRCLWMRL